MYTIKATFTRLHTSGIMDGRTTEGTCTFTSEDAAHDWLKGVKKNASDIGYEITSFMIERI